MTVAAMEKAESLRAFAKSTGAQLKTFALCLTTDEALELVDWLMHENPGNEVLALDAEIAHRTKNPWEILSHFALLGLDIMPVEALH